MEQDQGRDQFSPIYYNQSDPMIHLAIDQTAGFQQVYGEAGIRRNMQHTFEQESSFFKQQPAALLEQKIY